MEQRTKERQRKSESMKERNECTRTRNRACGEQQGLPLFYGEDVTPHNRGNEGGEEERSPHGPDDDHYPAVHVAAEL